MTADHPAPSEPVSSGSIYALTEQEITILSKEGSDGNSTSAFRLFQYYSFSRYDKEKARHWAEIAAKAGNPVAQHNLAFSLYQEGNLKEAEYWARTAISNGSVRANSLLSQILEKSKSANK